MSAESSVATTDDDEEDDNDVDEGVDTGDTVSGDNSTRILFLLDAFILFFSFFIYLDLVDPVSSKRRLLI